MFWKCADGHKWQAKINSRINKGKYTKCPLCSNKSRGEHCIASILDKWKIEYLSEYVFEQYKFRNIAYDFYVVDFMILIEYDGIQHFFNDCGFFEENMSFERRRKNDNLKNRYCLENNIPILRIPYKYNPDTEEEKIRNLLREFIETRKVPQEIIDYYKEVESLDYYNDYEVNNYAEIAQALNEKQ